MPKNNHFYDTNIFQLSINPCDKDCEYCDKLLHDPGIDWLIVWSEVSRSEANIEEFLDKYEEFLSSNGIEYIEVKLTSIRNANNAFQAHRRSLRKLGFQGNDVRQLIAAIDSESDNIFTRDFDFIDPRIKRHSEKKRHRSMRAVETYIKSHFDIAVLLPDEACAELLP